MSPGRRQIGEEFAGGVQARSVLARLVGAGREVDEAYDRALSPLGIDFDEYRILLALRHAGPQGLDSGTFHDALREIGASPEDESALENEGWLARDRRGRRTITAEGRQRISDLEPALETVEDRLTELLGSEELAELARILTKLVD